MREWFGSRRRLLLNSAHLSALRLRSLLRAADRRTSGFALARNLPLSALLLGAVAAALVLLLASPDSRNPAAAASTQFSLAQWSDVGENWQFGNLERNDSAYHEGESIPYVLEIDKAVVGTTYEFQLRYDCDKGGVNAFDFLTQYDRDRGTDPAVKLGLDPDDPTRADADINEDTTHDFDPVSDPDRTWRMWGATFVSTPSGPVMADGSPPIDCASTGESDEKRYDFTITATSDTVYLLWGGHLASGLDWGCLPGGTFDDCPPANGGTFCDVSLGACGISGAPFHQAVDVPGQGVGGRDRSIQPGAILPPYQPTIEVTKECTDFVYVDGTIFWSGIVTNANGLSLLDVTLTDDNGTPGDPTDDFSPTVVGLTDEDGDTFADDLADGASATWSFSRVVTSSDTDPIVNTIEATAVDAFGRASSDSASCVSDIIHPDILVSKDCPATVEVGQDIPFSGTVENTGDTSLDVTVVDDSGTPADGSDDVVVFAGTLGVGESADFAGSYTPSGDPSTNTVTAIGADGLQVSNTAFCTTDILTPDILVSKDCAATVEAGQDIPFSGTVENTGETPLDVTVVDDSGTPGDDTDDIEVFAGALGVGESAGFTGSYTPSGDPSTNTVTATGNAIVVTVTAEAFCTTDILTPDILVSKDCAATVEVGQDIPFSGTVENTGQTPLDVTVVDDSGTPGDDTDDVEVFAGALGAGESAGFAGSYTPSGDPSTNTVTATGNALVVTVTATAFCTTEILTPDILVSKECAATVEVGQDIPFSGTVENTGETPLDVTVVDDNGTPGDDGDDVEVFAGALGAGESAGFAGSYTPSGDPSTNTVTATGNAIVVTVTATAFCTTEILTPDIAVSKECPATVEVGQDIPFTGTVENTGETPLDVTVVDDSGTPGNDGDDVTVFTGALGVGESAGFTGSYTPSGDPSTNTVTATGNALVVTVTAEAFCTTEILTPDILVSKECAATVEVGQDIPFSGTVENTGETPLDVTVVDDSGTPGNDGDDVTVFTGALGAGESAGFAGTYTPSGDPSTNTVTATGNALVVTVTATAFCTTEIIHPAIRVVKVCTNIVQAGDLINITATVKNAGDTDLSGIVVSDSHAGVLTSPSGDTEDVGVLNTDEIWVYSGSHVAPDAGSVTDTVTAQGTPVEGEDVLGEAVSDSDDCVTTIGQLSVEVDKTADGSDPDSDFSDDESTTVDSTVTYKVVIDNDSSEPVTITSLLDDTYPGIVCRDSNGDDVIGQTLAADDGDGPGSMNGGLDEITCTFQAQAPSTPETVVTDVVTVEVVDAQENTADDSDDATIRTLPQEVLPAPTPTAVLPQVLPPTGGLGSLSEDASTLILLALLGLTLIGGSAWMIWSNRRWDNRRGGRS